MDGNGRRANEREGGGGEEGQEVTQLLRTSRWFPVVNDLIGGWSISNVDKPLSQQDHKWGSKELEVGDFLTQELATYVCNLHNETLDVKMDGPRVFPHHCHVCKQPARVWVAYCVPHAAKYLNMNESEKLLMKEIEGQGELWPMT